ncbi:DUF4115 domain-containing protein, partial [Massilia sp. UBA6681]|uniref:DUF4115 domain-containing protein n=1 Tax=Massilia sp. UBA6681 TaxID=1946839 RepID=UPI0025C44DFC
AAPGTAPAATAPATLAAPVTAVPAAPAAAGGNALVLNVREDAWIGVVVGGKRLLWREVKAGSTETFDVTAPGMLTVGNPAAVSATLRGSPVSLEQAPGKKFAQVSLK